MLRRSFPCAVMLLCLALRLPAQTAPTPTEPPTNGPITVPFAKAIGASSWIPIDVKINGKGPFHFILDTGAFANFISPDLAAELGITSNENTKVNSGGEKTIDAGIIDLKSVEIGSANLEKTACFIAPMPSGFPIRGMLGSDVFQKYVVTVNYALRVIVMSNPATFTYKGNGADLPLIFNSERLRPIITAEIDGIVGRFLLDTGGDWALVMYGNSVKANNLKEKYRDDLQISETNTVTGIQEVALTYQPTLTLGDSVLKEVPTELRDPRDAANRGADGNIGGDILNRFTVTFDYGHKHVYFEPNANYSSPYPCDRSGITCRYEKASCIVRVVDKGSPAAKADIRIGDLITQINGKSASQLDFLQIKAIFQQSAGTAIHLTVQRGKKTLEVTLILKDYE